MNYVGLKDIKSMLPAELEEDIIAMGEKKFRAKQIFAWLHRGIKSFDEMTDLSNALRKSLADRFIITVPDISEKFISKDGTVKYLWDIGNNNIIESVLLQYHHGTTICISSQAGCRMGCVFCASSDAGFAGNLSASDMLNQVIFAMRDSGKKISNIVVMGIGEPLDNYDNLIRFVQIACHPGGLNIGARHLTVSTVGLIENIDRLSDCGVQLSLAISLHAPDNDTRTKLIPYNRHTGVEALLKAADRYSVKTGRRVSFEYAMIDEVNDSKQQAALLSEILKSGNYHLNLIFLNRVNGCGLYPSKKDNINSFTGILRQNGITFTTRRSLGSDIEAACGQLRRKKILHNGSMGYNS